MKLSTKQRDGIYMTLYAINLALIAASQQGSLPAVYAHAAAVGSLVVASMLRQIGAEEAPQEGK